MSFNKDEEDFEKYASAKDQITLLKDCLKNAEEAVEKGDFKLYKELINVLKQRCTYIEEDE